jgi:hypothetical protein
MRHARIGLVLVTLAVGLGSCTTGQLNVTPPLTFSPTNAALQMSVGTVNFAGSAAGLNVLETDRSPSGFTAIPVNTVVLTGPSGFAGPAGSADPGSGAAAVPLGSHNDSFPVASFTTNLAAADGFGIGPPGSSSSSISPFPVQPQFLDAVSGAVASFPAQLPIYGGQPAYPPPSGPIGYPEGFYLLALSSPPPTGTYTLTVSYSQNGNSGSQTATATLASNALLPTIAAPSYTSDGKGGGSGSVTIPAGITETFVQITATNSRGAVLGSATVVLKATGAQAFSIPDSVGLPAGATLVVQAFGFDYDDFGLGPPGNLAQKPALPAQADVSVSAALVTTE